MRTGMTKLRWSALWLAMLWLCVWAVPILHQVQCTDHHHKDTTCPICQLAATSIISSPPQIAPTPVRAVAQRLPPTLALASVQFFQIDHPPRGPPPAFSTV